MNREAFVLGFMDELEKQAGIGKILKGVGRSIGGAVKGVGRGVQKGVHAVEDWFAGPAIPTHGKWADPEQVRQRNSVEAQRLKMREQDQAEAAKHPNSAMWGMM